MSILNGFHPSSIVQMYAERFSATGVWHLPCANGLLIVPSMGGYKQTLLRIADQTFLGKKLEVEMALSSMLGSLFGSTGTSLTKNVGLNKLGNAQTGAIQMANAEAEMEITAAELNNIDAAKKDKLAELDGKRRKDRMGVNQKNSETIQF